MKYISNYHTHCELCNHAKGNVEDYIKKAIEIGLKSIGMSDHAPFDFLNEHFYRVRMYEYEYPEYIKQIEDAQEKYGHEIQIYKGLEIEYFSEYKNRYKKLNEELDYLILGQHYLKCPDGLKSIYKLEGIEDFRIYRDTIIDAMSTGYFKIMAHPEIFLYNHREMTKEEVDICNEIIQAAIKYDVILEFNANGFRRKDYEVVNGRWFRRYPREDFWKLVSKTHAKVIMGADAHQPSQLKDHAIDEAIKMMKDLSLVVEEELVL
jgi:histidinol-phosphatase (PHP family)